MRRKAFPKRFSGGDAAQCAASPPLSGTAPTRRVRERDVPSAIAVGVEQNAQTPYLLDPTGGGVSSIEPSHRMSLVVLDRLLLNTEY